MLESHRTHHSVSEYCKVGQIQDRMARNPALFQSGAFGRLISTSARSKHLSVSSSADFQIELLVFVVHFQRR